MKITRRDWIGIVETLIGFPRPPNRSLNQLSFPKHACYPTKAFSLYNNFLLAHNLKADPAFHTARNYFRYDENNNHIGLNWPRPENVWMVEGLDLTPENYRQRFLPWVPRPKTSLNVERSLLLAQCQTQVEERCDSGGGDSDRR